MIPQLEQWLQITGLVRSYQHLQPHGEPRDRLARARKGLAIEACHVAVSDSRRNAGQVVNHERQRTICTHCPSQLPSWTKGGFVARLRAAVLG